MPDLGWWTISGEALLGMMQRCADGENPSMVFAEEYANGEHEYFGQFEDDDDAP